MEGAGSICSVQRLFSAEMMAVRELQVAEHFVGKCDFRATDVGLFETRHSDESVGFVDGKVYSLESADMSLSFGRNIGHSAFAIRSQCQFHVTRNVHIFGSPKR
jgi:hypothetical protein